jgi:putative transcriptional regulator
MRRAVLAGLTACCLALGSAAAEPANERAEFLVARKDMPDPNFHDAVVLVTRRGPGGAVGFIVNRPTDIPLGKALPDAKRLKGLDDKLYFGGPVMHDVVIFMFRSARARSGATEILPGVQASSDRPLLEELLARDKPTAGLRVYAGLAGWGPGQLESELDRGDWRRLAADAQSIFDEQPVTLWARLYRRAFAVQVRDGTAARVLAARVGR